MTPFDLRSCEPVAWTDTTRAMREACGFFAGETADMTLGLGEAERARLPFTHIVIRMQENRSFDHVLGSLGAEADVDGVPPGFSNRDLAGAEVPAFRTSDRCTEQDPPHQWADMVAQWNGGAMDGFVTTADRNQLPSEVDAAGRTNGHYVMGYLGREELPFYHWLADTFAIGDRYFSSSLGGTWSNRNFQYTGAAHGVQSTFDDIIDFAPSLFEQLTANGIDWTVYLDGFASPGRSPADFPRQDTIGWQLSAPGSITPRPNGGASIRTMGDFFDDLARGTLPPVTFLETVPGSRNDEHPPFDIAFSEAWSREIVEAARASPLWPGMVLLFNYDTAGGMLEHVPPPDACVPVPGDEAFTVLGLRVPFFVISPWTRPGYVSHEVHSHTSVLRFVQLVHGLPALTDRDATSSGLLDFFDLDCAPDLLEGPAAPPAARPDGCDRRGL